MVQKVAPFTVKLLRKRWFPPFSTSLFQAFRSRGDSAKRYEEKKKQRGVGSLFFSRSFPSRHTPLSERLEQAISQRTRTETLAIQAIRKGSFGELVMVIHVRCSIWKLGSILQLCIAKTIVKIANLNLLYRNITITSTCHNCKYLKEINAFLFPRKTVYKTTRKKLKYISCWYTLRKFIDFLLHAVTNVLWLVHRSWTICCRFHVLTQVKTGILDRSRAASQWKKCWFRIVGRNETTTSLFFGKINKVAHHFFFLFFFLLPPLSFFFQGEEHHTFPDFERSYHWGHLQDIMWQNSIRFISPPS